MPMIIPTKPVVGQVTIKSPRFEELARELASVWAEYGGPNVLIFDITTSQCIYTVTLQPNYNVKTPTSIIAELTERINQLEQRLERCQQSES